MGSLSLPAHCRTCAFLLAVLLARLLSTLSFCSVRYATPLSSSFQSAARRPNGAVEDTMPMRKERGRTWESRYRLSYMVFCNDPRPCIGLLSTLDTPQSKSVTRSATHLPKCMSVDGSGCSRARVHSPVWSSPMKSDAPSPNMVSPLGGSAAAEMHLTQKDKYAMMIEPDALNISKQQRNRPRFSEDTAMIVMLSRHNLALWLHNTRLSLRLREYNLW
jgi:hypothetical protein